MHFLGKNLRYLRKQSGKTQSEIASLIQKGQTTIGNWENGISEPSLGELLVVSNYFDIPIDALLKSDLAMANAPNVRRNTGGFRSYDLTQPELPVTGEQENLSFVLEEIKNLKAEMKQLSARLSGQKNNGQP
jgi:transcriptional regulator with XRE-family HTH domain